ncbi:MAG: cytochrome c3 family protein, partial [Planctomycetota bacterium]
MVAVRIALLVVAVVVASLAFPHAPLPASPTAPLVAPSADYVGSAACRKCHPAEHATWHGSFHRTMSQPAARANLLASFERLELDWWGKPVLLEWRGDTLWTKFERGGRRPAAVERPVEQLTGSHQLQVLWYSTGAGRELAPVPLCFKAEERVWLPLSAVFVLPPEFRDPPEPGAWSQSCSGCHATDVRPRIDIGRNDTHVGELGVGCESCHGPGGKHVAANQEPVRRYRARAVGADATVRNPDTLSPVRSAQACGQCHSVSILRQQHHESWREDGSPFRPGMDLHATHLVVGAQDTEVRELRRELAANPDFFASAFWSDGQVRLSGREFSGLRQSPCYMHGDAARQMDCTSCHERHPDDGRASPAWRRGQMRDGMAGDAACTQCHAQFAAPAALQAHTRHAPSSAGSRCYDCHMPHTSVGLMKASRSHQVTSPDVAVELATGRPNACNLCHLDQTLGWTARHLADWTGKPAPALPAEHRSVSLAALLM